MERDHDERLAAPYLPLGSCYATCPCVVGRPSEVDPNASLGVDLSRIGEWPAEVPCGTHGVVPRAALDGVGRPLSEAGGAYVPFLAVGLDASSMGCPSVGLIGIAGDGTEESDQVLRLFGDCQLAEGVAPAIDRCG